MLHVFTQKFVTPAVKSADSMAGVLPMVREILPPARGSMGPHIRISPSHTLYLHTVLAGRTRASKLIDFNDVLPEVETTTALTTALCA